MRKRKRVKVREVKHLRPVKGYTKASNKWWEYNEEGGRASS